MTPYFIISSICSGYGSSPPQNEVKKMTNQYTENPDFLGYIMENSGIIVHNKEACERHWIHEILGKDGVPLRFAPQLNADNLWQPKSMFTKCMQEVLLTH